MEVAWEESVQVLHFQYQYYKLQGQSHLVPDHPRQTHPDTPKVNSLIASGPPWNNLLLFATS